MRLLFLILLLLNAAAFGYIRFAESRTGADNQIALLQIAPDKMKLLKPGAPRPERKDAASPQPGIPETLPKSVAQSPDQPAQLSGPLAAAGSIASFVDKDNEYWIQPYPALDKSVVPINCSSYADAAIANSPTAGLRFMQITSTGQRLVFIWPKNGKLRQTIPNLENSDGITPYDSYSVNGNQFIYTITPNNLKIKQTFVYDQKNKFKRYVTDIVGPPADQLSFWIGHKAAMKYAKEKGLPGILEIKCIGNPNDL